MNKNILVATVAKEGAIISGELYASCVLAVLLSIVWAPFALRKVLRYYEAKAEKEIAEIRESNQKFSAVLKERREGIPALVERQK